MINSGCLSHILITGSKAIRITTESKYLSVLLVLRETEKNNTLKKQCTLKVPKDEKLNKSCAKKIECKT